ncbi:Holliday junction branch migration protein RuvA [Candidatus Omnitrophota bacterium]
MYELIVGTLVEKKPTHVVIDVNGIGYFIHISLATYSQVHQNNGRCSLYVHLIVREDDLKLFGFADKEEREVFRMLLSVSGIGPRVALTVLSGIGVEKLKEAIAMGNVAALTSVSGIGKKTAQRLIVELKEKVSDFVKGSNTLSIPGENSVTSELADDVLSALLSLGYKRAEATKAVSQAFNKNPDTSVEELIRESLNYIK